MPEKFNQYYLTETLSKKYSHMTYLASPINEPERQLVLTVFSSFLFRFPYEREGLLQKAQRMKEIQYVHLVPIQDIGIEEEQPFVAREYLSYGSLRKYLKQISLDRLPLRDALNIVSQVGDALAYAHQQNIVHGNIKPENIFLDANGQVLLTDFNLVSRKDASIRDQTSEEYAFCYLAPEQFAGIVDARSDQYALGCLTYELITGQVPFAAQSLASMMGQPRNALPIPLSESVADLPPSLDAAVLKTLAKDPSERFFDFSLFLEVIKSVLSPAPDFPLAHALPFRKNRAISRPMLSTKTRDIAFPISKRTAAPNLVSEQLKPSGVTSRAKFDAKTLMSASSMSHMETHEKREIHPLSELLASPNQSYQIPFPFPGEAHPLGDRENGKIANNWLISKSFLREGDELPIIEHEKEEIQVEVNVSPIIVDKKSIHDYDDDVGNKKMLLLESNYDIDGLQIQRGGRRVWGLVLLVSVVIILMVYVFWPLVVTIYDSGLRTANKTQGIIPQITSVSMEQVPLQITDISTVQPTVTEIPTVQPTVTKIPTLPSSVTNGSIIQSAVPISATNSQPVRHPTPMPTPMPTPTATNAAITYEAEASQNTLAGGAQIISCSSCSGGYRVGYLGVSSSTQSGILQFNNVNKVSAGTYTLTLYYSNGSNSDMNEYISINGGSAIVFTGSPTGSFDKVVTAGIAVALNGGNNTIKFYNPSGVAPDMDKIIV